MAVVILVCALNNAGNTNRTSEPISRSAKCLVREELSIRRTDSYSSGQSKSELADIVCTQQRNSGPNGPFRVCAHHHNHKHVTY